MTDNMSWKTTSVFFMGFSAGMVYVVACNGDNKTDSGMGLIDTASANPNPNPNPNPTGSGRAVVEIWRDVGEIFCWGGRGDTMDYCTCPTGFSHVGWSFRSEEELMVCLEN